MAKSQEIESDVRGIGMQFIDEEFPGKGKNLNNVG